MAFRMAAVKMASLGAGLGSGGRVSSVVVIGCSIPIRTWFWSIRSRAELDHVHERYGCGGVG